MTAKIEIEMNNVAFEQFSGTELARILRKVAGRIDGEDCVPGDVTPCMDHNGNEVGQLTIEE